MFEKKYHINIASVIILITFLVSAIITLTTSVTFDKIPSENSIITLDSGWTNEQGKPVSSVVYIDYEDGVNQTFYVTLPNFDEFTSDLVLFYSTKYMNVELFLDDEPLASVLAKPDGEKNSLGKIYKMIPLTEDFSGKILQVDVELPIGKEASYEILAPMIGSEGNIVLAIFYQELFALIMCVFTICFSVILIIFGLFRIDEKQLNSLSKFGLFAFLFAIFCMFNTDLVRILIGNSYFSYFGELLILAVLPIPFLVAIKDKCTSKIKTALNIIKQLLYINVVLQVVLHFFTPLELRNTIVITNVLLAITVLAIIIAVIRGCEDRRWIVISISPVLFTTILDLLFYTFTDYNNTESIHVGVLIFIIIQIIYFSHSYFTYYKKQLESEFYKRAAYFDSMTNVKNRSAFEEKIVTLNTNLKSYMSVWCIVVDMNYLKHRNDTLGHTVGDKLIKDTANLLKTITENDNELFRTGGDEFVLLITDSSKNEIEKAVEKLNQLITEYNNCNEVYLSIAIGYDTLSAGDNIIESLIYRADALMYKNKQEIYNSRGIKRSEKNLLK